MATGQVSHRKGRTYGIIHTAEWEKREVNCSAELSLERKGKSVLYEPEMLISYKKDPEGKAGEELEDAEGWEPIR